MKKIAFLFFVFLFTQAVLGQKVNNFAPDFSSPPVIPGMTLVWNDEFNTDGFNPFLQPHYLLLNLAIGAAGGDPSKSTFPIKYEVDWVRVYQKK